MLLSGVYVLSDSQPIFVVADSFLSTAADFASKHQIRAHFLVFPMWYAGDVLGVLSAIQTKARARPHRVTWMCNAQAEVNSLKLVGQSALFCNQNLFCDESIFTIKQHSINFDAIYIARLDPYKRLWLAAKIPSLRIIAANYNNTDSLVAWGCEQAKINRHFLGYNEIAEEICKSKCGLALSKKEGGMFAVTEYLLCGRPVVSTPSRGGREVWFNSENHLLVPPNARLIAQTIAEIERRGFDPTTIRNSALELSWKMRKVLYNYLHQVCSSPRCSSLEQMSGAWLRQQFVPARDLSVLFARYARAPSQRSPAS